MAQAIIEGCRLQTNLAKRLLWHSWFLLTALMSFPPQAVG